MGFVAAEAVDPLEFDLSPYGPKGVIPEPSDKVLFTFQKALKSGLEGLGVTVADNADMADLTKHISALDLELQAQFLEMQTTAFAGLCGGMPSLQQLQELPTRIKNAFVGWVMGQFNDPGHSATGTNA